MAINNKNIQLVIPEAILLLCDLTAQQKFIYALICSFHDERGRFDLDQKLCQKMTRISREKFLDECEKLAFFELVKVEKIGRQVVVSLVDKDKIGFPA